MCGIVGICDYRGIGQQTDADVFDAMVDSLTHRGPDGRGVWRDKQIALGHRRLAILDPTPSGAQPMTSHDGRFVVTYNGEIYNFVEIRDELKQAGHQFRSNCDTEVILAAFEQWGIDCIERFNGIFAFALWESRRRRLWLVRDRLGVKPLFYSIAGGVLRFASEIKAMLADPAFPRRPSLRGLNAYLSFGYVPAPLTGFNDLLQLPPAHYALIEDGQVETKRYWSMSMRSVERTDEEAAEEFSARLQAAVRRQMVSDVPLGAFLSGGIDSAAVVAEMAEAEDRKPHSFCVSFREKSFDESAAAEETARIIGSQHKSICLDFDLATTLDRMVEVCDEPFADSSSLAVYHLCRATRDDATVALAGDGADELLAGYPTYAAGRLAQIYRHVPRFLRKSVRGALALLSASERRYNFHQFATRFTQGAEEGEGRDFASWRIHLRDAEKVELCRPDFFPHDDNPLGQYAAHYWNAPEADDNLKRMLFADLAFYLPNDMLVKVDRMSMAHGLEVRVPFLDHEFVEFCTSLPSRLLARPPWASKNKLILRRHLRKKLGRGISSRRKTGFNVPIEKEMRDSLLPLLRESIRDKAFREDGPFEIERLDEFVDQHRRHAIDAGHALFGVLVLARWWAKWF